MKLYYHFHYIYDVFVICSHLFLLFFPTSSINYKKKDVTAIFEPTTLGTLKIIPKNIFRSCAFKFHLYGIRNQTYQQQSVNGKFYNSLQIKRMSNAIHVTSIQIILCYIKQMKIPFY